ncbi:MAG: beta-lactamase family protein [bacterium]|nr:beta-lactamase family protein [bacterium]
MSEGMGKWMVVATVVLFLLIMVIMVGQRLILNGQWDGNIALAEPLAELHESGQQQVTAESVESAAALSQVSTTDETDLDSFIKKSLDRANIPALSAAIVKGGKIVWSRAYGWSRVGIQPASSQTLFQIASVSKTVLAVAAMKAWEEGAFDLDQDINTYLPFKVKNPFAPNQSITPRMLLTHTATIRDQGKTMDSAYVWDRDSPIGLGEFLKDYLTPGGRHYNPVLNFYAESPGSAFHYSNIGATLAAYLVEVTTGLPFDLYCQQKIFQPLGMKETSWRLADLDHSHIAMPYGYDRLRRRYYPYGLYAYPDYPDGLLKTSAPQLARFLLMFINYGQLEGVRILNRETVEEMRRVQNPAVDPQQGILWYYKKLSGWKLLGHNGADMGVGAEMFFRPEDGLGVILLMNGDRTLFNEKIIRELEIRLFKEAENQK